MTPEAPGAALGWAEFQGQRYRCALGRTGLAEDKREGDGHTPAGAFPLRRLWHRPDVYPAPPAPAGGLPVRAIAPDDGWCDEPTHPLYNRPVKLPFAPSHEDLWRTDGLYDLFIEVGYNDDPPVAGKGSAIFIHVARPGYAPTAGCVALARADLLALVAELRAGDRVVIRAGQ
ncbi:MAG: L,D-transpeptidase family protein [Pseudomonadota bacterium]